MRKKKHDLISNCPEEMVALMKDWILDQLEHQQQDDWEIQSAAATPSAFEERVITSENHKKNFQYNLQY